MINGNHCFNHFHTNFIISRIIFLFFQLFSHVQIRINSHFIFPFPFGLLEMRLICQHTDELSMKGKHDEIEMRSENIILI